MSLGEHWSWNFLNDPKRLGFVLSRYKFAAKMACKSGAVLELGCSMGMGATILGENATRYTGVDLDRSAIETAQQNLSEPKYTWIYDDFLGKTYGAFDGVVSLDVIEHIYLEHEELYFQTLLNNLAPQGICVVGTPNITASPYASAPSQLGHVNLYSQTRLQEAMQRYFHQVFAFGMNDEVMHTGFGSMAHYLMCVGFYQK
jgi:2-polyprenyl-3-methyl-5-hydroxy-6-metoxy-1,4-benzoquinol methylase